MPIFSFKDISLRTHQQFPRQHISLIPHLQISHPLISINLLWERSTKYIRLKTKCGSLSSFLSFVMCNFFPFECVARDNHSFSRCSSIRREVCGGPGIPVSNCCGVGSHLLIYLNMISRVCVLFSLNWEVHQRTDNYRLIWS